MTDCLPLYCKFTRPRRLNETFVIPPWNLLATDAVVHKLMSANVSAIVNLPLLKILWRECYYRELFFLERVHLVTGVSKIYRTCASVGLPSLIRSSDVTVMINIIQMSLQLFFSSAVQALWCSFLLSLQINYLVNSDTDLPLFVMHKANHTLQVKSCVNMSWYML